MELNSLREQIDRIDDEILQLFVERMGASRQVALYKKEHGLPVLNAEREAEVLGAVESKTDEELRPYALKLYSKILELSREYQEETMKK